MTRKASNDTEEWKQMEIDILNFSMFHAYGLVYDGCFQYLKPFVHQK